MEGDVSAFHLTAFWALQGELGLQTMTWGLVPSWTKPGAELDFYRMFNARSETVPEKGVFKRLLEGKRCVVLLNGFYEWAQARMLPHASPGGQWSSAQAAIVPVSMQHCMMAISIQRWSHSHLYLCCMTINCMWSDSQCKGLQSHAACSLDTRGRSG